MLQVLPEPQFNVKTFIYWIVFSQTFLISFDLYYSCIIDLSVSFNHQRLFLKKIKVFMLPSESFQTSCSLLLGDAVVDRTTCLDQNLLHAPDPASEPAAQASKESGSSGQAQEAARD